MGFKEVAKETLGSGLDSLKNAIQSGLWKEYFESGDMSEGILMKRGILIKGEKNANKHTDENLISSGSGVDIQSGQCAVIVDNGQVVDFCAKPGRYTYDKSSAPSVISGENNSLVPLGKEILRQWSTGGSRFSTQRIYFINLGELIYTPIKWGCSDIAFHHVNKMSNGMPPIELDMTLRGNGQVTIKIVDPVKFFTEIGAQKTGVDSASIVKIDDEGIMSNLKSGIIDKIAEAISIIGMEQQIPYTGIRAKSTEISKTLNKLLSNEWTGTRGFAIASFSVNGSFIPLDDDLDMLKDIQSKYTMAANVNVANYDIQKTMAEGVKEAGKNGGASGLFGLGMGLGMIGNQGIGTVGAGQPVQQTPQSPTFAGAAIVTPNQQSQSNEWTCTCGTKNASNFCQNCGQKRPDGKIVCDKCGWVFPGGTIPKFCPNCGDPITQDDKK